MMELMVYALTFLVLGGILGVILFLCMVQMGK